MIKITSLNYQIQGATILHDVNLTLPEQGITAIIGANGAGKSTLLSLVARLEPLQSGEIWIDDCSLATTPSKQIAKKLAILTQHNEIQSRLTVYDLLMFGRYPHHQGYVQDSDKAVVEKMMQRFALSDLADRYLGTLSGGQRQRALIAMTFCQETPYVLLDEPLNNLDMFHARELMRIIHHISTERHLSTIMVVHDINMAAMWAHHIIAMKNGQVALQGDAQTIMTKDNIKFIFGMDTDILQYQDKPLIITHV